MENAVLNVIQCIKNYMNYISGMIETMKASMKHGNFAIRVARIINMGDGNSNET